LPEHTKVRVVPAAQNAGTPADDPDAIAKQRAAWQELFAKMKADPCCQGPDDGFSGRDHDKLLYGGPNGPA